MRKNSIAILIGLALLFLAPAARAALSVQVDRDQLSLDETLTLTISKEGSGSIAAEDLKPLGNDFQVLGQSQSSSTEFVNGSLTSSFTLTLELAPKRAGLLTIPALRIGKESSQPLQVKVLTQAQPQTRAGDGPLFLETEVDAPTVLVQEQVLYTLRIYAAVEASINAIELPPLADALVEKLDDRKYTKVVKGHNYNVFARTFAIFPQKSGVLEIPPPLVQATVAAPRRNDLFSGFFGTQGEPVRLQGAPQKIIVREKPLEYPAGAVWLPTAKLSLGEDWSRDSRALRVGESVTVTIGLAGEGLLGAQLPKITLPEIAGVKLYQDQGAVENLPKGNGITGVRKESIALVPLRPGNVDVPEIRVPWWDKVHRKVAYAVIPARRLVISAGAPGSGGSGTLVPPPGANPESQSAVQPPDVPPVVAQSGATSRPYLLLGGVTLLLALGWLATLWLLWKTRRQLAAREEQERQGETVRTLRHREAFQALARACRNQDPVAARAALLAWAELRAGGARVRTPGDLERLFPGTGLAEQLAELDRALFGSGQGPTPWSGEELLPAAEKVGGTGGGPGKTSALPPLYR